MKNHHRLLLSWSLSTLLLCLAALVLTSARDWMGRPFPGFLVLENGVVASAGLESWPASEGGQLFQTQVVAIDGGAVAGARELHRVVRARPPGTPFRYRFRRGDVEFERVVESRSFGARDFSLLFGVYLLNGLALGASAVVILLARRRSEGARSAVPLLLVGAVWGLTAVDLYGPYRFFRLHALCESFLFAAAVHMALGFPRPLGMARRRPGLVAAPYLLAIGLAGLYQLSLEVPGAYVSTHLAATSALGAGLLALILSQLARYLAGAPVAVHRQIRILAWGAVAALSPIVMLTLAEPWTGGRSPQNAVGFTAFLFAVAIGFAGLDRSATRRAVPPDPGRST